MELHSVQKLQHGFENPVAKYSTKNVSDRKYSSTAITDFREKNAKNLISNIQKRANTEEHQFLKISFFFAKNQTEYDQPPP